MQISIQINLRASTGMPKRRQLKSCIDLSRPYFLLKVVTQVLPTDCPNKSMCRDLVPGGSLFFFLFFFALLRCTPYLSGPSCSFAFWLSLQEGSQWSFIITHSPSPCPSLSLSLHVSFDSLYWQPQLIQLCFISLLKSFLADKLWDVYKVVYASIQACFTKAPS